MRRPTREAGDTPAPSVKFALELIARHGSEFAGAISKVFVDPGGSRRSARRWGWQSGAAICGRRHQLPDPPLGADANLGGVKQRAAHARTCARLAHAVRIKGCACLGQLLVGHAHMRSPLRPARDMRITCARQATAARVVVPPLSAATTPHACRDVVRGRLAQPRCGIPAAFESNASTAGRPSPAGSFRKCFT